MEEPESAFSFEGNWQEFMPIALTNLLLTIVTLGIYRFWATARERRYLWSRTRFIDERFEWSGTGLELLIGFLLVIAIIFVPLIAIQFLIQALAFREAIAAVVLLIIGLYFLIFYLVGVARFRGLRYRLSRTWWRGIRGGSDDQGLRYGWSYLWRSIVGFLAMGLMVPWSMTTLWNERWNAMSFGGTRFTANAQWGNIFLRYIICYFAPWIVLSGLLVFGVFVFMAVGGMGGGFGSEPSPGAAMGLGIAVVVVLLSFYIILPLFALAFYAGYLREAVGALKLGSIDFAFTARTKHWILLFLGNLGLWLLAVLVAVLPLAAFGAFAAFSDLQPGEDPFANNPLGLVVPIVAIAVPLALVGPFIRYRTWRFGVRYLEASGEIDADALTQSTTREPTQGEGLLDAFDIGAI